jgi:hypothetical protein
MSINKNAEKLLNDAGIYYKALDEYHNSHSPLYQMAADEDWESLRSCVSQMINEAKAVGATKMLISAERLFLLAGDTRIFSCFTDELRALAEGNFRLILVVREMRNYLKSYITQLINNGSLFLEDTRLAAWTIGLVKTHWDLPDPVTMISFDKAVSKNALVDHFSIALGCEGLRIPEVHANITPRRTYDFSAATGVACRLMSLSRAVDVNSYEMDLERRGAEEKFDRLHTNASPRGDAFLDEMIENALDEYIGKCLGAVPADDRDFYGQITASPLSWNYPRAMGGAGFQIA